MTVLATPTPYLRDGLRKLVNGLRRDAETVRLNLAEAEQDVADARQILAEAEAQHKRAKDAADALDAEIAFFEREAERTPPAYDPDAALAATGLMREELRGFMPRAPEDDELPAADAWNEAHPVGTPVLYWPAERSGPGTVSRTRSKAWVLGHGAAVVSVEGYAGGIALTHVIPLAEADDDLTAPGVADSRAQVAPHLPPPVATSGPLMTMPDLSPARKPLDPPPGEGTHTHAKDRPGLFARLTGGHRIVPDQNGDADE